MGNKYNNPPLQESYCEFFFEKNQSWDLVTPGLLYDKLKELFPVRKSVEGPQIKISGPVQILNPVEQSTRMRLYTEDEACLLQIDHNFIAINRLPPHITWSEFIDAIGKILMSLTEVVTDPVLRKVTLRYINRIEIPEKVFELDDYFKFYPKLDFEEEPNISAFLCGVQIPFVDSGDVLKLEVSTGNSRSQKDGHSTVMLDLQYFSASPGKISIKHVFDWLDIAHKRIEKYFELSLTAKTKTLFS